MEQPIINPTGESQFSQPTPGNNLPKAGQQGPNSIPMSQANQQYPSPSPIPKIIIAGVIVVLAVGGFLFFRNSKQASNNNQSPPNTASGNVTASGNTTFSFLNTEYVLGYTAPAKEDGQVSYEFVPKGETVDTWTKLITTTRDGVDKATPEELDYVAEVVLSTFKSDNVFVYNSFTFDDGTTKRSDIITAVFPGNPAEVSIIKMFINDDGYIVSDTYAVKIAGGDDAEVAKAIDEYLATTKDIGTQFIKYQFPEPWK